MPRSETSHGRGDDTQRPATRGAPGGAGGGGGLVELEVIPSMWPEAAAGAARRQLTLAVIAAASIITALLWWLLTPSGQTARGAIPPSPAPPTPTVSTAEAAAPSSEAAVPTADTPVPTVQPATGNAADVAAGFAADYANTDGGKDAWFARISRWTSPKLTDSYRLTDPHRLPDNAFQRLSPPLNNDSGTVIYNAFYDTITLEIRVAFRDDHWQVVAALDATPQRDSSPPSSTPAPTTPTLPDNLAPAPGT
ncbi:hypothetical protein PJJ85_15915 [Mycobacterium kansasii]